MTKDRLLKGMTKDEITAAVDAVKKGSFCFVEFKDGAPIPVTEDITIVTTVVVDARFVNYGHTKLAKTSEAIRRADSTERLAVAKDAMQKLNAIEKQCMSKKLQEEYTAKTAAAENNRPLWITPKREVNRNIDADRPYLSVTNSGSIQLSVNRAYRYDLNKREISMPKRKYYIISKDSVGEITSNFADVLKDVAKEARELAGKKENSAPSSFYSINIANVCGIYKIGKEG